MANHAETFNLNRLPSPGDFMNRPLDKATFVVPLSFQPILARAMAGYPRHVSEISFKGFYDKRVWQVYKLTVAMKKVGIKVEYAYQDKAKGEKTGLTIEPVKPVERAFEHSSKPLYVEPRDVKQVGRVVTREVETRVDQSDFKRRVTLNYGGKCAITGHGVAQTLQAAHIAAFATDRNNNTSNGILMDVALHVLFDAGLMAINPENMCVYFNCQHPLAQQYGGKTIAAPRVALDVEALTIRWNRFK